MGRILLGEEARRALHCGLSRSAAVAAITCAPMHGTVLYERGGRPRAARDGFEAVRESADEAGPASIGARILKETLAEAQRDLGDGTARIALFIDKAMETARRHLLAGASPGAFADALLALRPGVEGKLEALRCPAPPADRFARAGGLDEVMISAFAGAIAHAGVEGAIDLRLGHRDEQQLELGTGFLMEAETVTPRLPPAVGGRLELTCPLILVVNEILSDLGRLTPLLDQFATRGKSLAVIARGASGSALDTLVVNGRQPGATLTALQPLAAGMGALAALEDLAIATGATLIDPSMGTSLDVVRPSMLGQAKRLSFARGLAAFEEPSGDAPAVAQRQREIHAAFERQRYLALDREQLARRAARLSGRWARIIIRVPPGERREEAEERVLAFRKLLARMGAAVHGGVVLSPTQVLLRFAAEEARSRAGVALDEALAARVTLAAGLRAVAKACGDAEWEALPTLLGIVQKGISATATMLRIEAIVSN